jgi:hypothetical protein
MVDHEVMIAAKVAMLEFVVRDLLIDRFNSVPDPIGNAMRYAETRWKIKPGVRFQDFENDLEPIRQAVWQEFLDSVVAGVRKMQEDGRPQS